MSDYPMLISNKLHSFRNFCLQINSVLLLGIWKTSFFRYLQLKSNVELPVKLLKFYR